MQLDQAYRQIVAYRRLGVGLYTFAIAYGLALVAIGITAGSAASGLSVPAVLSVQVVLIVVLSLGSAWSCSLAVQARTTLSLPRLIQPLAVKLLGPSGASQLSSCWAALTAWSKGRAIYTATAGVLGALYVTVTLFTLTPSSKSGASQLLKQVLSVTALDTARAPVSHVAYHAGTWLYGLIIGMIHVVLSASRYTWLEDSAVMSVI